MKELNVGEWMNELTLRAYPTDTTVGEFQVDKKKKESRREEKRRAVLLC